MDKDQFHDFLGAHEKNLGADFVNRWKAFFNTLQTANRLFKSCFDSTGPGNPGEMQGTLLLAKMQQEMELARERVDIQREKILEVDGE